MSWKHVAVIGVVGAIVVAVWVITGSPRDAREVIEALATLIARLRGNFDTLAAAVDAAHSTGDLANRSKLVTVALHAYPPDV